MISFEEMMRILFSKFFWKFMLSAGFAVSGFVIGDLIAGRILWVMALVVFASAFSDFLDTF